MATETGLDRLMQERRERLAKPVVQQVKNAREYAYQLVNDARTEVEKIRAEADQDLVRIKRELKLAKGSLYDARKKFEQESKRTADAKIAKLVAAAERDRVKAQKVLADAEKKAISNVAKENLRAKKAADKLLSDARRELANARTEAHQIRKQAYEEGLELANVTPEEMAEWKRIEGRKRLNAATHEMFPRKRALKVAS